MQTSESGRCKQVRELQRALIGMAVEISRLFPTRVSAPTTLSVCRYYIKLITEVFRYERYLFHYKSVLKPRGEPCAWQTIQVATPIQASKQQLTFLVRT